MEQEVPGGQSKGFKALPDNVYDCQQSVLKVGGGAGLQRAPPSCSTTGTRSSWKKSRIGCLRPQQQTKPGLGLHLSSSGTGCLEVGVDLWSSSDKDPKSGMVELWQLVALGRERILHFQDY